MGSTTTTTNNNNNHNNHSNIKKTRSKGSGLSGLVTIEMMPSREDSNINTAVYGPEEHSCLHPFRGTPGYCGLAAPPVQEGGTWFEEVGSPGSMGSELYSSCAGV